MFVFSALGDSTGVISSELLKFYTFEHYLCFGKSVSLPKVRKSTNVVDLGHWQRPVLQDFGLADLSILFSQHESLFYVVVLA